MRKFVFLPLPLVLLLAGCATPQAGSSSNDLSAEQQHLSDVMKDYRIPAKSIPPLGTGETMVDLAMNKLATVATLKAWTFDGSRAREGVTVISRPGNGRPMLVGVIFFIRDGHVGSLDMPVSAPEDTAECQAMRDTMMNIIKQ